MESATKNGCPRTWRVNNTQTIKAHTMAEKEFSLKKTAHIAGGLYLLLAITGAYSLMVVPSQIMVQGDAAATARNILANEFLFRTGIVSNLVSQSLFVFLVMVLYRLFKEVNEHQARLMVALVLVSVPIMFLVEAFKITALMVLKGDIVSTLAPEQMQDWAMMFMGARGNGIAVASIFWGLWLIPFGQLVYRSGFIPRFLGILLIAGGVGYVIEICASLLFPNYAAIVSQWTPLLYSTAEVLTILWLLIMGAKTNNNTLLISSLP